MKPAGDAARLRDAVAQTAAREMAKRDVVLGRPFAGLC